MLEELYDYELEEAAKLICYYVKITKPAEINFEYGIEIDQNNLYGKVWGVKRQNFNFLYSDNRITYGISVKTANGYANIYAFAEQFTVFDREQYFIGENI